MGLFKWLRNEWEKAGGRLADVPESDPRPIEEKIAAVDAYQWTKEELNLWLDTLPAEIRDGTLRLAKSVANRGADWHAFLCQCRLKWEAKQQEKQQHAKASRTTLGDLLWAWDEGMKMGEERRFYQEQHERWQKEKKEKGW